MEQNIGKNKSSGAKKVERIAAENETTAADVNAQKTPAKKTTKSVKKTSSPKQNNKMKKAKAKEDAAAEKRLEAAKVRAQKKEQKLMKKAEWKQKKIEKRAALKQKKLERKEMIAKKRAERKQAIIDKRAALKEKRVEQRAEKIARREMLRNESKAEKQKRLEREKKDRIALKRQKQEAAEKAREQKRNAREAAHARKAEDRKHKREQKTERKKRAPGFGGWLAAVISLGVACLALASVVTAGAFQMNDMTLSAENNYRATLYEMVSVSEDMDNNLTKLRVSSGSNEQRKLLTDVLVDSMLLESAIERIPVDAATSTDISAFVNKTGSYARTLLNKLAAGEKLSQTEKNTIAYLADVNSKLYNELNTLATTMTEKQLRDFMHGSGDMTEKFGEMGQGTKAEPDEIVDAPFAGEGNVGENRISGLEEISEARAEELVKEYLSGYHVRDTRCTGETVSRDVTCYNFALTDENDVEIYAQISKNGGKLVFFDTYETCTQKNFDLNTCDGLAREFLASLGIENVEAVWLSDAGMVADITYVSTDGGVRAYPDMIKVRVCESKGRVVGMDAKSYLVNYQDRDLSAGISEATAKSALSQGLEAQHGTLALIPVDGKETLAYEFFCKEGETEYVVYIDAHSGDEIQIYRIRNSASGSYLR